MSAPRLCLNHDADYDWLIAVDLGRIDVGQGAEVLGGVSNRFGVLHDGDGRAIGFKLHRFSTFDAEAPEVAAIWAPPLYDAPVLGLRAASAGGIILAARAHFGGTSSVDRGFFDAAAALMRDAVTGCGALVQPGPSFLEASLVRAFCESAEGSAPVAATGPVAVPIPGWNPQPGATDIAVTLPAGEGRVLAEAKVDDIDQLLWDLFKMASASEIDGVRGVCLLGAARAIRSPGLPGARWAGSRACAELFDPENSGRVWDSADMLRKWASAWAAVLKGGRGHPTRVPARVRVAFLGSSPVLSFPGYEARCIEIRVEGDEWLAAEGPSLSPATLTVG